MNHGLIKEKAWIIDLPIKICEKYPNRTSQKREIRQV